MSDFVIEANKTAETPISLETLVTTMDSPPAPEPVVEVSGTNVTLLDTAVKVEVAPGLFRLISYFDFLEALKTHLNKKDGTGKNQKEFQLPTGVFYLSISEKEIRVSSYYPECYKEISYNRRKRLSVIPNIIVSLTLVKTMGEEYKVNSSKYFCTSKPLQSIAKAFVTTSSGYSLLPFTNCYSTHDLCFGSAFKVSICKLPDMRPIYSYYQVLFDSDFNDDLGIYAASSSWRGSHEDWYANLAKLAEEKKGFPYELLRLSNA